MDRNEAENMISLYSPLFFNNEDQKETAINLVEADWNLYDAIGEATNHSRLWIKQMAFGITYGMQRKEEE